MPSVSGVGGRASGSTSSGLSPPPAGVIQPEMMAVGPALEASACGLRQSMMPFTTWFQFQGEIHMCSTLLPQLPPVITSGVEAARAMPCYTSKPTSRMSITVLP